jgi:phenylacetate-CoA ligase
MPDIEQLYDRLPVGLQHASASAEGLRIRVKRYGPKFARALDEAEARQGWTTARIEAFRDARIASFVRHAFETVPYYRDLGQRLGLRAEDIKGLADLDRLPVLAKSEVQADVSRFQTELTDGLKLSHSHTSGTTGAGLQFVTTEAAVREQWAVWWRYRRLHGIQRTTWCGYFGGRSVVPANSTERPFWRYNVPARQILFSGYHLGPETARHYVDELRRRRPPWLHGYPSLLVLLAQWMLDGGMDLGYEVRWVTTGAENLMAHQVQVLTEAFGVAPLEHYGLAEAVANASLCRQRRLHVDEDFAAVELVPVIGSGALGVVGTNLSNLATPLLRYETGDLATWDADGCPCGQPGRVLLSIDGRREDYVVLPNGARIGRLDHVFKDLVNVRAAQIRQSEADAVVVRVLKSPRFTDADEALLLSELRRRLPAEMKVTIEYPADLERTSSGKLRLVVSDVAGGKVLDNDPL